MKHLGRPITTIVAIAPIPGTPYSRDQAVPVEEGPVGTSTNTANAKHLDTMGDIKPEGRDNCLYVPRDRFRKQTQQ